MDVLLRAAARPIKSSSAESLEATNSRRVYSTSKLVPPLLVKGIYDT